MTFTTRRSAFSAWDASDRRWRDAAVDSRCACSTTTRAAPRKKSSASWDWSSLPRNRLLAEADFVSLHVPLVESTRHYIGAAELGRMKSTAILVNTARGPVVDEHALAEALKEKRIASAGLDVFEREPQVDPLLLELENVVLAPHIGSASIETRRKMSQLAAENCAAALEGRRPPTLVNAAVWTD